MHKKVHKKVFSQGTKQEKGSQYIQGSAFRMLVYAGGSSTVSGSAGSWALLGPASSCWTILTALSCLGTPDLRELVKPADPGGRTPTSNSGVTSENDVTPDCRHESDSKAEPAIE
jgi:hypothetical protein